MRSYSITWISFGLFAALLSGEGLAQKRKTRDTLVREDKQNIQQDGFWIYNDLPKALAEGERTGKPLLVVLRCIPCEACAQLDSDVVERDRRVRGLLEKFVPVRIIQCNGLDLSLFQFDYDQSFAAFFMNADKTIYGRYGTRSHQSRSEDDVSLEGFAAALKAALDVHQGYPGNKAVLAGKQSRDKPAFAVPEQYPLLKDGYTSKLNYQGQVARSCIHCHQVGQAQRRVLRDAGKPIPDKLLFPYPHPKALGLIMDPNETATIKQVSPGSPAKEAGFEPGDEIVSLAGQPMFSMADIQWVLHNAPEEAELTAELRRSGKTITHTLPLKQGWRSRDNIAWRATSWGLRRMTTGGLKLEDAGAETRRRLGLTRDALALRVQHVGQYGAHALAKNAGFRKGDIIISIAGRNNAMRETDVFVQLVNKKIGEQFPVTVMRGGRRTVLRLRTQE